MFFSSLQACFLMLRKVYDTQGSVSLSGGVHDDNDFVFMKNKKEILIMIQSYGIL